MCHRKLVLALTLIGLLTTQSCEEGGNGEDPVPNKDVKAERTNVKAFEIINLISHETLANKYDGTFGSADVELLKTSDTTLTFFVPDVPEGEASLKFELATIRFNVARSKEVDKDQLLTTWAENFDARVSLLDPMTPDQEAEIEELNDYKQEVLSLFNSLSEDEKRQAVMFYEANKEVFKTFAENAFAGLDGSTSMSRQSECPRTDFKTFYGCTAENLGEAAIGLKNASKEFLTMLGLAGLSAYLAPASFGLSAVGTTLALGTAGYLLLTEVRPAALHFKHSLYPFLEANWIFTKAVFAVAAEEFQSAMSTNLNLKPGFRSMTSDDGEINAGSRYFIGAMGSLDEYWKKLAAIFGDLPSYRDTEEATTLATDEITISAISNPNVKYLGNTGQSVKFESLSGAEEEFTYHIKVSKEGFVEEATLNGKVVPPTCDPNSILGTWRVEMYNTCYPNDDGTPAFSSAATLMIYEGGQSVFRYDDGSEYAGTYTMTSSVSCAFRYDNISWCGGASVYPDNEDYLHYCGCLSLKHIKQ